MGGEKKNPTYFFDSHGALWEALQGTEGYDEAVAFGPTGVARGVNARNFYEVRVGETDYAAAKRLDLVGEMDPHDGWAYLDIPDEGPFDLELKGEKTEELPEPRLQKLEDKMPTEFYPTKWVELKGEDGTIFWDTQTGRRWKLYLY